MHKFITAFLFAAGVSSVCLADEKKSVVDRPFSLGFGIGPTYGAGVVGRYDWQDWALQANFLPYYARTTGPATPGTTALFVGGVTGFYSINRGKYGNLYASLGAAGEIRRMIVNEQPAAPKYPEDSSVVSSEVWTKMFAVGPGLGFQIPFADNFSFSFEVPVAVIFNVDSGVKLDSIRTYPNSSIMYSF